MELHHEFFGSEEYENRRAEVWFKKATTFDAQMPTWSVDIWYVKFFENDSHVGDRTIVGHSERYVEDCAENWVIGVINV